MSSNDVLKLMKDKQVEFVDLRFTDPKGKLQHLTIDATVVDNPLTGKQRSPSEQETEMQVGAKEPKKKQGGEEEEKDRDCPHEEDDETLRLFGINRGGVESRLAFDKSPVLLVHSVGLRDHLEREDGCAEQDDGTDKGGHPRHCLGTLREPVP